VCKERLNLQAHIDLPPAGQSITWSYLQQGNTDLPQRKQEMQTKLSINGRAGGMGVQRLGNNIKM